MTSRRRFLTILAGGAALPLLGASSAFAAQSWQGIALGAKAQIVVDHARATTLIEQAVMEVRRLETIFSLYQASSQLSRLNRDGMLSEPAFEFVELLSICTGLNARTHGAFDPTIQPLWTHYAAAFAAGGPPDVSGLDRVKRLVGWQNLSYDAQTIRFARPGMAMTLNGVAQGYIADKITRFFRDNGVANVLVNAGEVSALGVAPDGAPWQVKLGYDEGRSVALSNASIATSSPHGTLFEDSGNVGHIIDPRSGKPGGKWSNVSVTSTSAARADGLSTAFCLMSRNEIDAAIGPDEVILKAVES